MIHCPSFPSLSWSPSLLIFSLAPHPPGVIYCSQYPSSQQAAGVGEKFLPQIKWSEIKRLLQRFPCLVTLKEIGPLAVLTEAPQFPKTRRTQFDWIQCCDNKAGWLSESRAQFSYVRELEECCSILPSHFPLLLRLPQYTFIHFLKSHSLILWYLLRHSVLLFPVHRVCLSEVKALC